MDSVTAYEQGLVQLGVDRFNDVLAERGHASHPANITFALETALLDVIRQTSEDIAGLL